MKAEDILVEAQGNHVLLITLKRTEVRNALRTQTLAEIAGVLNASADSASVRVVVLTGGSEVFSAGGDIEEMAAADVKSVKSDPRPGHWRDIAGFPKPLIAAVNGPALGAGNELVMLADIVIAGDNARFGHPEVGIGIIPGAGGTQRLPRIVGKPLAMKMLLSGEPIDAETAQAAGLVAEVTAPEETVSRALELARTISAKAPVAVRRAKAAVLRADEETLSAGMTFERRAYISLFGTFDREEGIKACIEKRKPTFEGH